ncbi:MAG TPA: MOSC domain-containing protein [Rhizomicrobium sp.]|jgi:MOSC domain-containing protein YiiM|nr:MOSC domain-containing protein [Rhizomicrobium sp.]
MEFAFLASVQTGRVAPLGPEHVPSGIVKNPRTDEVRARRLGLEGDEQADLIAHGGPEKAVYGYAASHYPDWAAKFPKLAPAFQGGAMGENLTVAGMNETDICVGDIHAVGSALLQVCQPRQPCFKFALLHDNKLMPKAMVKSGHSGWYYRVVQEGILRRGDAIALHDRPNPDFPFARLVAIVYHGKPSQTELTRMSEMPGLASQWRERARELLGQRIK